MITKERNVEKMCSFYASEFHLEMIMLPYINRKINEKANIVIMTEKNLKETVEVVISKINLPKDKKNKILNLNWDANDCEKFKKLRNLKNKKELIIFIIGNINYIDNVNKNIENIVSETNSKIIDCYSLIDAENCFKEILENHEKVLNTISEKEIIKNY